MQHAVLRVRNSRMRFNTRLYRLFPLRPSDQRVVGELMLSHYAPTGAPGRICTRAYRRTAAAAGAAQPVVAYGFESDRVPRASSSQVDPLPRVPRPRPPLAAAPSAFRAPTPVLMVPIPYDGDRAEPLGVPLLRLSIPPECPSASADD